MTFSPDAIKKQQAPGRSKDHNLFKRALARAEMEERETLLAKELGYYPRALCQIALPVRSFSGGEYYRKSGSFHLSIQSPAVISVPWGIYPRGILIWMASEVVKRKNLGEASRTLVLGNSLMDFMSAVSGTRSYSGGVYGNIAPFKRQLASLLSCRISYWYGNATNPAPGESRYVQPSSSNLKFQAMEISSAATIMWVPEMADTPGLFQSTVTLGESFWKELVEHAVPVDQRGISALWPNCLSIDIFIWLNYRADTLLRQGRSQIEIPWDLLKVQFGSEYKELRFFKPKFEAALKRVKQVYPDMEYFEGPNQSRKGSASLVFRFKRTSVRSVTVLGLNSTAPTTSNTLNTLDRRQLPVSQPK